MQKILLMRGLPGSGKSTYAREMQEYLVSHGKTVEIYSTDDFWMEDGVYKFDIHKISKAHRWNQDRVALALAKRVDVVIVDNTNLDSFAVGPYFDIALKYSASIRIVNVPTDKETCIARQADRTPDRAIPKDVIEKMALKMDKPLTHAIEIEKAKIRSSIVRL